MKKIKLVIPLFICMLLVACEEEKANTKDNELSASVHASTEDISYKQAVAEADLIVEVSIQKMQGVIEGRNNIIAKTKFEGQINNVYSGSKKVKDTISILQEGKNGMEIENYPLFEPGENYILMLMDSGDGKTYWIKGQLNGTYLIEDKSTLKFGKQEVTLPEKKDISDVEASIIEKQKETGGNSQILDTAKFKKQIQNDVE
ncbi:hypothetical protein HCJ13_05945 [Listeria booriae]|uniref:hypothetical protein n=1 Tax=Listeria booriae TaxID=1552123 RepID=UPI0016272D63|nr:hypothetical protein [Listeria booriae]MBC1335143.1 hypothetical protein [Listeria booriae]MBC1649734.1 hypothetical protein [Listeria booriae]MBC6162992.1 hypothetical protein [Listeria booriae]